MEGQAGAAVAAELGDKPESAAFRFSSHQDALDYASEVVENSQHWLATKHNYVAEGYKRGEFEVVIEVSTGVLPEYYHLIFAAIPSGRRPHGEIARNGTVGRSLHYKTSPGDIYAGHSQGRQKSVLIDVSKFVQTPQDFIPVLVRLEPAKHRHDVTWHVLTKTLSPIFPIFRSVTEGKVSEIWGRISISDSGAVSNLVENGSQIVEGIRGDIGKLFWERLNQLNLVQFCDAIRIQIDGANIRLAVDETYAGDFQISGMFLCAC
jgi:hypothetical protein